MDLVKKPRKNIVAIFFGVMYFCQICMFSTGFRIIDNKRKLCGCCWVFLPIAGELPGYFGINSAQSGAPNVIFGLLSSAPFPGESRERIKSQTPSHSEHAVGDEEREGSDGRRRGVYAKCKRNSRADLPPQPEIDTSICDI